MTVYIVQVLYKSFFLHLIFTTIFQDRYYPLFIDKETEAHGDVKKLTHRHIASGTPRNWTIVCLAPKHIALLTSIFFDISVCTNFYHYERRLNTLSLYLAQVLTSIIFNCGSVLGLKGFRGLFPAFLEVGYLYCQSILKPQFKKSWD